MSEVRNVYPIHFALWAPYAPPRALPKQVLFHLPPSDSAPSAAPSLVEGLLATAATSNTFKKAVTVVPCTPTETRAFRHVCEYDEETGMRRPLPSHFLTLPIVTNPDRVDDLEEDSHSDKGRRGFMRDTLRARYSDREAAKAAYLASLGKEASQVGDDGASSLLRKMDHALATHRGVPSVGGDGAPTTLGICEGTVVQGAYGAVDDCGNMLPNATLCCDSIRDAWRLFQQSEKLAADIAHQRLTASELIWARGPAVLGKAYSVVEADAAAGMSGGGWGGAIVRLSEMVNIPEYSGYRAFVLITSDGASHYLGACQKQVEAVYDALADLSFDARRSISNCIERAMSCLFDTQVNGQFDANEPACSSATKEVDSSELLSPTATLTEKLNLLCARQLFTAAENTALLVGVDISFESPSLPLYVFGLDALPMTSAETEAFLKPSVYPQEPFWKADRVPFCRLFRSLERLRVMYRRSEDVANGDADTEGDLDAPCNDPFLLFVARDGEDVFGDIKLVTNHQQYSATGDVNQHHQLKARVVALELQIRALKESRGLAVPTEPPTAPASGGQGAEGVSALIALMKTVSEKEKELEALSAEA